MSRCRISVCFFDLIAEIDEVFKEVDSAFLYSFERQIGAPFAGES